MERNKRNKILLTLLSFFLQLVGYGLLFVIVGWKVMIAVFLLLWSQNIYNKCKV